jgi:hypothetical protein
MHKFLLRSTVAMKAATVAYKLLTYGEKEGRKMMV